MSATFDTLDAAFAAATNDSTIQICPGTFDVNGQVMDQTWTVQGSGDGVTVLSGAQGSGRILNIQNEVVLEDMTLQDGGGMGDFNGGAIYATSHFTARRVTLQNNTGNSGGAIWAATDFTLEDANFVGNEAKKSGGAIWFGTTSQAQIVTMDSVNFSNNVAAERGGAIWIQGRVTIATATFTGNQAAYGGAIIARALNTLDDTPADRKLTDVVLHKNNATMQGGALYLWTRGAIQCNNCSLGFGAADDNTPDDVFATGTFAETDYVDNIFFECTASMNGNTVDCPDL